MFEWLKSDSAETPSYQHMLEDFTEMLVTGRHMFDLSANAVLGGADPEVIRKDLFASDRRINAAEQKLRRELIVHATVHGSATFPACLILMSIAKDAERIGDYGKNLFDVAACRALGPNDPSRAETQAVKESISELLGELVSVYSSRDESRANDFLIRAEALEDRCDKFVDGLMKESASATADSAPVSAALAMRHMKRITSHAKNIVTSIVMPLDKLDYFDEPDRKN